MRQLTFFVYLGKLAYLTGDLGLHGTYVGMVFAVCECIKDEG